jgi:glycosyltransferase involved in cell wall biosynthesis
MISNQSSILWMPSVDSDNINAQSLNAREIALRLDADLFRSTFFYEREPDQRLVDRQNVRLVKLPATNKTLSILREMHRGHALIAYADSSPASYLFVHSPWFLRRGTRMALHVEAPAAQSAGARRLALSRYKSIARRCDAHFGITEYIARDMENRGLHPVSILPIGVDTRRFVPRGDRRENVPTVLFAGTVVERKGVHLIVDVAREVPEANFLIVGAARDRFDEAVRQRIQDLGVENVRMLGPQSQNRMVEIMQRCDIFLLPSHLEGLPKVTLEAAATGLPCVVFNTYETPSVIDGLTGFQVANLPEMVRRVALLARDADLRRKMGREAIQHALKFDWNVVAAQWQQAYLRIAKPSPVLSSSRVTRLGA